MKRNCLSLIFLITFCTPLSAHDHAWWPVDVDCEEALSMAHEKCSNWDDRDQDHFYDISCFKEEMKKYNFDYSDFGLANPSREARPFYNEFFCHRGY